MSANRHQDATECPVSQTSIFSAGSELTLPHLRLALDAREMQERFAAYVSWFCPDLAWTVVECRLEETFYKPEKRCGILYRLTLRHPTGVEMDEWCFGQMYPPGRGHKHLPRALARVTPGPGDHPVLRGFPWISLWADLDMLLWVFPYDPKIATLPLMVDADFVKQQIETNLSALGWLDHEHRPGPDAWRCVDVRYDRIKYMPGKRCVLHYHATLANAAGTSRDLTFYSKTYNDARGRYYFDMLQNVWTELATQTTVVHIPRPLLYLEGANTFWQAAWEGRALSDVFAAYDWDQFLPRLASMLATIHHSQMHGCPLAPDLDAILAVAIKSGTRLVRNLPHYQRRIDLALRWLIETKTRVEEQDSPCVPIHGACRIEQMVVRGDDLALLDFDTVALGDPLYDVAELAVSLQYLALSHDYPYQRLARAIDLLCRRYEAQVAWPYDRVRVAWYAVAFFIQKMFLSMIHLDHRAVSRFDTVGSDIFEEWLKVMRI
jgi:aminoglycoside phosphotransferase (APT) family kinase protein